MDEVKPAKPTHPKRSVSLRADQWIELERYALEEARHGMVSRALQEAVDVWMAERDRPRPQRIEEAA